MIFTLLKSAGHGVDTWLGGEYENEVLESINLTVGRDKERHIYSFKLGQMVLEGLRNSYLGAETYADYLRFHLGWGEQFRRMISTTNSRGRIEDIIKAIGYSWAVPFASCWRYVEGTNVTIFADPNVEGRYHFGVTPPGRHAMVGSYTFDTGEYDQPKTFRKHLNDPFVAAPYIEVYNQVRGLPLFDTTQSPVMELQGSSNGQVYFCNT